jgi:hypothetical protein
MSSGSWPSEDEISVRFLFHNSITSNISQPTEYLLFGANQSPLLRERVWYSHEQSLLLAARETGVQPGCAGGGEQQQLALSLDLRQSLACHWG